MLAASELLRETPVEVRDSLSGVAVAGRSVVTVAVVSCVFCLGATRMVLVFSSGSWLPVAVAVAVWLLAAADVPAVPVRLEDAVVRPDGVVGVVDRVLPHAVSVAVRPGMPARPANRL